MDPWVRQWDTRCAGRPPTTDEGQKDEFLHPYSTRKSEYEWARGEGSWADGKRSWTLYVCEMAGGSPRVFILMYISSRRSLLESGVSRELFHSKEQHRLSLTSNENINWFRSVSRHHAFKDPARPARGRRWRRCHGPGLYVRGDLRRRLE